MLLRNTEAIAAILTAYVSQTIYYYKLKHLKIYL